MICFYSIIEKNNTSAYSLALHVQSVRWVLIYKTMWLPRPPPPAPSLSRRVALTGSAIVMRFCCVFLPFSIRIELTLNDTGGKLLNCKALLMKITKTASFFSFSVPFDVINSSSFGFKTRRGSYFPLETGANCQTGVLKRIKKIVFLRFIARISEKLISLVYFENVNIGIANK